MNQTQQVSTPIKNSPPFILTAFFSGHRQGDLAFLDPALRGDIEEMMRDSNAHDSFKENGHEARNPDNSA